MASHVCSLSQQKSSLKSPAKFGDKKIAEQLLTEPRISVDCLPEPFGKPSIDNQLELGPSESDKPKSHREASQRIKQDTNINFKLKLPVICFEDKSVDLGDDEVKREGLKVDNGKKGVDFTSGVFRGFEIANLTKDVALSDSPFAKALESRSPMAKKSLKQFRFNE